MNMSKEERERRWEELISNEGVVESKERRVRSKEKLGWRKELVSDLKLFMILLVFWISFLSIIEIAGLWIFLPAPHTDERLYVILPYVFFDLGPDGSVWFLSALFFYNCRILIFEWIIVPSSQSSSYFSNFSIFIVLLIFSIFSDSLQNYLCEEII